jgi:signal transduction histidine kinase
VRIWQKSALVLVGCYALIMLGLAVGMEVWLRSVEHGLANTTSRMIARQVAATLSAASVDRILDGDPNTGQLVKELIADLTDRSEVVASLSVIDATGTVLAGDQGSAGTRATPDELFSSSPRLRLTLIQGPMGRGHYRVRVPLTRDQEQLGYLEILLSSSRIDAIYRQARRQFTIAGLIGIAIVGILGFLLQEQLSKRGETLASALEAILRGEVVPVPRHRDEFSEVLSAANQLGEELRGERHQRLQRDLQFGALARVMEVGVILLGGGFEPEFASPRALELLGYESFEALKDRWDGLRTDIERRLSQHRAGGGIAPLEVSVAASLPERAVYAQLYPLRGEEPTGFILLLRDRSQADQLDAELRLASQARALGRAYTAFAHELRAPLNAISLNLELLRSALSSPERPAASDTERKKHYVEVVSRELSRLNRSLEALLTQTVPPSDTPVPFDLRSTLIDLQELIAPQASKNKVELVVSSPTEPVTIVGYPDRLKQAVLAVCINGLEAMPDGGTLSIHLEHRKPSARIRVCDTGPGIQPDLSEQVFEMQFTTKDRGSGIGLFVAQIIVESHGGEIHLDTGVDRGACFEINLPLQPA